MVADMWYEFKHNDIQLLYAEEELFLAITNCNDL